MMTDKELLELAAKAAGNVPVPLIWERPFDEELTPINDRGEPWNPLTDDGDALRLAVKLGIHQTNSITDAWASTLLVTVTEPIDDDPYVLVTVTEPIDDDPYAATRRAIVRAAAEIGKAMP